MWGRQDNYNSATERGAQRLSLLGTHTELQRLEMKKIPPTNGFIGRQRSSEELDKAIRKMKK